MRRLTIASLAALTLAGCGSPSVSVTNVTPEEAAKAVEKAGGIKFQPGEWETRVEMVEANIEGMPPEAAAQLTKGPNRVQTHRYCMTPEQAAKPGADAFGQEAGKDASCKVDHLTMAGGRYEQQVSCTGREGKGAMVMKTSGAYTAESMTGTVEMDAAPMKMKANIASKRVGECPAGSEKAK